MHLDSMWLLSELSLELDQHCRSEISLGEPLHGLCSLRPLPYYAMRRLVQTDVRRSDARVSLVPQMLCTAAHSSDALASLVPQMQAQPIFSPCHSTS